MNMQCVRCETNFDDATFRGYCDGCKLHFTEVRQKVHARQRPQPGVCADGKFAEPKECPQSVLEPFTGRYVCGLCGSDELEPGYGIGGGYGMGSYNFCGGCNNFLDFSEDAGE